MEMFYVENDEFTFVCESYTVQDRTYSNRLFICAILRY